MKLEVAVFVVCFLEEDIGTDTCLFQFSVVLNCCRSDIYVNSSDITILMVNAVDRLDALEDILDRIVLRILTCLDRQSLMTHILKCDNFLTDLFLSKLLSRDRLILCMIRAVQASVDAVIREIQRREKHYSVSVVCLLDLFSDLEHLLDAFRIFTGQQHRRLPVGQSRSVLRCLKITRASLLKDRIDQFEIILICFGICQSFLDFFIIDKLVGNQRLRVILIHVLILLSHP